MSETTIDQDERDGREFVKFLGRVRRRVLLLALALYLLPGAALGGVLALLLFHYFGGDIGFNSAEHSVAVLGAALACGLLSLWFSFRKRRLVLRDYVAYVDHAYDAAGRIQAAAEFVLKAEPLTAFQRLALADAARWIRQRPRVALPWSFHRKPKALRITAALLCAFLVAGCESPQPAPPRPRSTKPEPPVVTPHEGTIRPRPPKIKQPSQPVETQPAAAPPIKPDEGESDSGQSGDDRSGAGNPSTGDAPGAGMRPAPQNNSGTPPSPIAPPTPPLPSAPPAPQPGAPSPATQPESQPNPEPFIGPGAGTETGPKQEDQRQVEAPEEEIAAKKTDDETGTAIDKELEGEGEDFVPGSQPAPVSQAAETADFREARRQDLTRERVSPERRALIERYFQRLNRTESQPASQPASRPSARATTQPNSKSASQSAKKEKSP